MVGTLATDDSKLRSQGGVNTPPQALFQNVSFFGHLPFLPHILSKTTGVRNENGCVCLEQSVVAKIVAPRPKCRHRAGPRPSAMRSFSCHSRRRTKNMARHPLQGGGGRGYSNQRFDKERAGGVLPPLPHNFADPAYTYSQRLTRAAGRRGRTWSKRRAPFPRRT